MHERSALTNDLKAPASNHAVTRLLLAWGGGDQSAFEELIPIVHDELRRLARRQMRGERPGHTLQPTALVHEAYLRLVDARHIPWKDRTHFFAIAARSMRQILVEFLALDAELVGHERGKDVVALDDALQALAALDARKAQVVELRFFGGLSVEETAETLEVSPTTVARDWRLAKVWLLRELTKN
jgi:RNA polymerase sigma-70 factor, ECF subfamily